LTSRDEGGFRKSRAFGDFNFFDDFKVFCCFGRCAYISHR